MIHISVPYKKSGFILILLVKLQYLLRIKANLLIECKRGIEK